MEEREEVVAAMNPNDLNALASILFFYERYLWSFTAPSAARTRQITEIQFLLVKVQLLASTKAATLTFDEIDYIEAALRTFTSQMQQKMPQSKNRDDVLESCEGLREHLVNAFAPSRNRTND
jgi:hypothetical protein